MVRTSMLVALAVGLAACAGRTAAPASPAARPCTVPTPTTDPPWREVRATSFSFCVPVSWRPQGTAPGAAVDPRTWRSESGSITWGTGVPPTRGVIVTESVILREGTPPPHTMPRPDIREYTEVIGGRRAEVTETHSSNLHQTEARWRDPDVYLHGQTANFATAQLLLAIHRTVRFLPTPPP